MKRQDSNKKRERKSDADKRLSLENEKASIALQEGLKDKNDKIKPL